MISWAEYYSESQRYEELRREADRYRLIQQATGNQSHSPSLYSRVRSWIECRMTTVRYRLMERRGGAIDAAPTC